ncbi:MAG: FAD-dependent oxidoreductase [Bryobacteraceae bacterium]|nr:FAD-dependent oxidoreductase [Bryobacteraceae bacterium]MDW8377991.1 FAD-dependent oxidoreductase [Bryobacterales bacterium]
MGQALYAVQPPDATDYWVRMVKCQDACPVHTDACGYVTAIAEGRYEDAFRIARATNPFVSICGRVCGAPCELNCRRGAVDSPVTIRALKRFVNEMYGPETGDYTLYKEACDRRMLPPGSGNQLPIAVVGAGVSGLTVAHDLAQIGYKVTVFEAHSEPGGMLTVGVPIFRLPRDVVRHEIQAILSLGVELRCNMRLGRDFTISSLRKQGYRAIFLGIGLPKGRKLPIPGSDHPAVYDGLEFLRSFNEGKPLPLGRKIVVIGGGNVAYDVARSAIRPFEAFESREEQVAEMERGEKTAYDVARSALRMSGDKSVAVVCLEKRHEMPADVREIEEGEEEGIRLYNGWGPQQVVIEKGKIKALRVMKCLRVFDEDGKFNPQFDPHTVEDIEADTVLFAIGQSSDLSFLSPEDGVETARGLIKVNPETYQTTAPDVFACGDIAHGPKLFIHAIASAQIAARSMHDFLTGSRTDVVVRKKWTPASYTMVTGWHQLPRQETRALDSELRSTSLAVTEINFTRQEAETQASRCLRCNINTVFDTSICIACHGCVDICPKSLIRLVGLGALAEDPAGLALVSEKFGVDENTLRQFSRQELDQLGAFMMKDESTCIRCALCASRCPTHAITMQRFEHYRECVRIPTPNTALLQPVGAT